MKRNLFFYLLAGFVALLVASCSSTRRMQKTPMIGGLTGTDYMEKVIEWAPRWQCVTGKVALNLNTGKSANKVSATLRIKRGDVIQLSVAPLLGIEVARMEITPEGILVVDRMNKRFVRATKDELKGMLPKNAEFSRLEKILLDASLPGGKTELSGKDIGIPSLEKAKVQLYEFSTKEFSMTPTELTSKYRQVPLEELVKMLVAFL